VVTVSASVIRAARERAGITQGEMVRRAGTSRPTVSAHEAGRKSPSLATAQPAAHCPGGHLVAEDDIAFTDVPVGRGRTIAVPNRLPRLPVKRALAVVELPLHVSWSTTDRNVDLAARHARARAYELLLSEGTAPDIAAMVDGALLADGHSWSYLARFARHGRHWLRRQRAAGRQHSPTAELGSSRAQLTVSRVHEGQQVMREAELGAPA